MIGRFYYRDEFMQNFDINEDQDSKPKLTLKIIEILITLEIYKNIFKSETI